MLYVLKDHVGKLAIAQLWLNWSKKLFPTEVILEISKDHVDNLVIAQTELKA